MRIGILFGGKSREREISFAGGRTVYDLLDKSVFEPVPIFIDSLGNFILLDWQYLYKGSIRDFYPSDKYAKKKSPSFQVYVESITEDIDEDFFSQYGKQIHPHEFKDHFDFAFLALHGPFGEDGSIQGILSYYQIPFSGSGILPSAIGIDKSVQKQLMAEMAVKCAKSESISRAQWEASSKKERFARFEKLSQFYENKKVVLKSVSQGSSIGVRIYPVWNYDTFTESIDRCFFIENVKRVDWESCSYPEKVQFIHSICDINEGLGIPVYCGTELILHPDDLLTHIDQTFSSGAIEYIRLQSLQSDHHVLIEEFIAGKEFSCIVVEDLEGKPIALPPTEIIKKTDIFNYRAKYLPGISRKITPIEVSESKIDEIRRKCEMLYEQFHFDVYARIDGMLTEDGTVFLNDPNTTSGMLPSSFFFHQAAEIGLSPTQFLSYIISRSLECRMNDGFFPHAIRKLIDQLEIKLESAHIDSSSKPRVAVVMGGNSTERHISVESGRNVFEKLSSSGTIETFPVFLTDLGNESFRFDMLPLNLMLKDNADDIREKVLSYKPSVIIDKIIEQAKEITGAFGKSDYSFMPQQITLDELCQKADFVFIALHGRPGEDGALQKQLESKGMAYNGSGILSSSTTINKYVTNEILSQHGMLIPAHLLITREQYYTEKDLILEEIKSAITYPLIAKPADDGCSSAVKKIDTPEELQLFADSIFRRDYILDEITSGMLGLAPNEEFPQKDFFVVEELVRPNGADHFVEITGGMLTQFNEKGERIYEVFEASEALASKGILSLEEKFLAGEGQNITPARYSGETSRNKEISHLVKEELEKAAKVLNVEGYCRIDAFVRIYNEARPEVIFIEVNSLPGLTPATCIFHQAAINGYKPSQFLEKIIEYGQEKIAGR